MIGRNRSKEHFSSPNVANEFSNGSSSVLGQTIQISGVEERDLVFNDDLDGERNFVRVGYPVGELDLHMAFLRLRLLLDCDLNFEGGSEFSC